MTVSPESIRVSRMHLDQGVDVGTIEWSTRSPRTGLVYHQVEQIRFSRPNPTFPLVFRVTLYDRHLGAGPHKEPMRVTVTVDHTTWTACLETPLDDWGLKYHRTQIDVHETDVFLGCRSPKTRTMPDAAGEPQTHSVTHHECTINPNCDCNGHRHTSGIHTTGITESYQPAYI